ncbi:hypothetical protein Bcep1808_6796 (plasmid) [Burkholderia vietnamiensis G4]|uniref:Uncharacterized protein n=1 Tax=Burkholderia vietnamiensis (strain G4 / LMG 22486) TaxID=269482 RepID=A4JTT0_BURVG|nr:hypothetical protein Bcep1808_6796 [Burkholderia vietnamiensis G4]
MALREIESVRAMFHGRAHFCGRQNCETFSSTLSGTFRDARLDWTCLLERDVNDREKRRYSGQRQNNMVVMDQICQQSFREEGGC